MSLFVVVFHNGSIEGDCQELSVRTSMSIESIEQALALIDIDEVRKTYADCTDISIEELQDELEDLQGEFVGAYVIDAVVYDKYTEAFNDIDAGSDIECDTMQSLSKSLARSFALKSLGQEIKD